VFGAYCNLLNSAQVVSPFRVGYLKVSEIPESTRPNIFSLASMSPKIGLAILGAGIFAREGI
jgi:hypothetical protein